MKNSKAYELFLKGYNALEQKEYLIAENYFLASLYEYSKDRKDYAAFIGSLDRLSMYVYPEGYFENKERALRFYNTFSRADINASLGYAVAIINGVFGEPDYDEAIRQLSKISLDDKLFLLAKLLHEGKGLAKDDYKSAVLLKRYETLYRVRFTESAKKLYKSINIKIDLTDEELKKEIDKILDEIFKYRNLELEDTDLDFLLTEFFNNEVNISYIKNISDVQLIINNDLPKKEKKENDFDWQVKALKNIYNSASLSPVFKKNSKYCIGKFAEMIPYISYVDVMDYKYIIRAKPLTRKINNFDTYQGEIIVQYDSIEELVKDGWQLD